jgi:hypothetical protein
VDSTEQPRERPVDNQEQQAYYSGKKKNHTFKNQLISLPKAADIVDVMVGEKVQPVIYLYFADSSQSFLPHKVLVEIKLMLVQNV